MLMVRHIHVPDPHPIGRGKILRIRQSLAYACAAAALLIASMTPSIAGIYCDFESGLGRDGQAIRTDINGLSFSTTTGGDIYYADINTGNYSVTSDNGKAYECGDYFMSGDVAAYVANVPDIGRISFQYGTASYLTLGYCAGFPLTLEAYDTQGTLLGSAFGSVNTRTSGGLAMGFLTVTGQSMSYVLLRGTGGYWMIDNISTDAPVPEPSSILAIGCGLAGLLIRRLRVKRNHQLPLALFAFILAANTVAAGPLMRLYVKPGRVCFRPGMQQKFQAYGTDLMDNIVPVTEPLTWSTTAGTITQDGTFTAGTTTGNFWQAIKVRTPSGLTGIAAVSIETPSAQAGYVWERSWGNCPLGQVVDPDQVAVAPDGSVYVPDRGYLCVQHFDSDGRLLGVIGYRPGSMLYVPRAVAFYGGYIYIASSFDISKWDANGNMVSSWGGSGSGAGQFTWIEDMTMDKNGNFYVLEDSYAARRVQKFNKDGGFINGWGTQGSGDGQFNYPSGICVDANGNVYVADSGNNRIEKFDSNGNFLAKWTDLGPYGPMYNPTDIAVDQAGYLYVPAPSSGRILKLDSSGTVVQCWTNDFSNFACSTIALDSLGNMYTMGFTMSAFVQKRDAAGKVLVEFGRSRGEALSFPNQVGVGPDGTATVSDVTYKVKRYDRFGNFIAKLNVDLDCLCVDKDGCIYVCAGTRLDKYSASGSFMTTFDLSVVPDAVNARSLAVAPATGDIYLLYSNDYCVARLGADGRFISKWGSQGTGNGQFSSATGITVDSAGNVYVVEASSNRIQKFDAAGNYITQWGQGRLNHPMAICATHSGSIVVTAFQEVVLYSASGTLQGSWGSLGTPAGCFANPYAVAVDADDNIYVADGTNSRIQKFQKVNGVTSKAKALRDGDFVALTDQAVTASYGEAGLCFYVESLDRACGIRVTGTTTSRPSKVTILGVMSTVDGERTIKAASVTIYGTSTLAPYAMTNKSLGGAALNYDPATGSGQMGVEDGQGANNVGLLVTTTGRVTGSGTNFFYIDDGTHARDGSIFVGVRVLSKAWTKPRIGAVVTVTGISRINKIGDRYFRCVAPRAQADIVVAP